MTARPARLGTSRAPAAIGIDLGGTKLLAVAVDGAGSVLSEYREPAPSTPEQLVEAVAALVRRLDDPVGDAPVGIGLPGLVTRTGLLRFAPHLPQVRDVDLGRALSSRLLRRTVVVDNDVNVMVEGERCFGALRGVEEAVAVTLGTGIGGALVVGGRLVRGSNGFAGEPGHMVVVADGEPCPCGRRGCWECYASGEALGRRGREIAATGGAAELLRRAGGDLDAIRGEHVTGAASSADPVALAVLAEWGRWVALGLANLVRLTDPDLVVIGGGLVEAGEALLEAIRFAYSAAEPARGGRSAIRIEAAVLGERAGAIGAAALARRAGSGRSGASD